MPRYPMRDGTVVDTANATLSFCERRDADGVGRSSGSREDRQTLRSSRRGRYYLEFTSTREGHRDHVEWVSDEAAARWLLLNEHDIPSNLVEIARELSE